MRKINWTPIWALAFCFVSWVVAVIFIHLWLQRLGVIQ